MTFNKEYINIKDDIPSEIEKAILDYIYLKLTYENLISFIKDVDVIELFTTYLIGNTHNFVCPKRRSEINKIMDILENNSNIISGKTISNIFKSYVKIYQYDIDIVFRCIEKSDLIYFNHCNNENILFVALENLTEDIMDIDKINQIIIKLLETNDLNNISNKFPNNTPTILLFKMMRKVPYSNEVINMFIENNFTFKLTDEYGRTALDYCIINYFTREYYDKEIILKIMNHTINGDDYIDNFYDKNKAVQKRSLLRISKDNLPNFLLTTYGMNDRYEDDYEIVSNVIYTLPNMNKIIYNITLIAAALQGNIFSDQFGLDMNKKYYFNDIIKYILDNTSDNTLNKDYENIKELKNFNLYYEKPEKFCYNYTCQYDIGNYVEGNYDLSIIRDIFKKTHEIKIETFFFIFDSIKFNKTCDYDLMDLLLENINLNLLKEEYEYQLTLICYLNFNANDYDDFLFNKTDHEQHQKRIQYIISRSLITNNAIISKEYQSDDYDIETIDMETSRLYLIDCFKKYFDSQYLLIEILRLYNFEPSNFVDIIHDKSIVKYIYSIFTTHNKHFNMIDEIKNQFIIMNYD